MDCNGETRSLARSLLRQCRYFWCKDLDATEITNNLRMSVSLRTDVTCIGVSPNEQLVAVGYKDGWFSIFNVPDFKELFIFNTMLACKTHCSNKSEPAIPMLPWDMFPAYGVLWSCSFSPSSNRLLTCNGSEEIKLWDVNNKNLLRRLQAGGPVDCCCFSDCGLFIVATKETEVTKPNDVFTVWNALTLERVDRRNIRCIERSVDLLDICKVQQRVVLLDGNKKSQLFLSTCSDYGIDVFQLPDALLAARLHTCRFKSLLPVRRHHRRNCVLHHINQCVRLFNVNQLEYFVLQQRSCSKPSSTDPGICFSGCLCSYLQETGVVPVKVKKLYVVPVFAKLKIFSTGHYPSISIQPSFVSKPYVITSCCFSPDGSFLATCANDDPLSVVIWDTMICTIVDVLQLQLNSAGACWWSDGLLWIYDACASLVKIPISNNGTLDSSGAQKVEIDWKPRKFLTFSDVLIFIDQEDSVNVARIVNGELQYVEKIPVDDSSICAAVSPSNSVILTANFKTFHVWKENQAFRPHWRVSNTGELPDFSRYDIPGKPFDSTVFIENNRSNCCITTDGTRGVLSLSFNEMMKRDPAFFLNHSVFVRKHHIVVVVELESSTVLKVFRGYMRLSDMGVFYAGNSYYISFNEVSGNFVAKSLKNGKVVADWQKLPEHGFLYKSIVVHSKNDLVAVITCPCGIQFLKIVVPE